MTGNQFAARKGPLHRLHTDRQQALAAFAQHAHGAGIERQPSGDAQLAGEPLFARRHAPLGRRQAGADRFARKHAGNDPLTPPRCDHRDGAGACRLFRRHQLAAHAAATQGAGVAGHGQQPCIAGVALGHQHRADGGARVGFVQTFLVGEDDEHIGLDQIGDQRRQRVVVAETDFIGGHGVVLVDDRHHPEVEQGAKRAAHVQIAFAVDEIFMRQQHLRRVQAVPLEGALVGLHQPHLADRRHGLQLVQCMGTLLHAQALHARGHRARRDQQQLEAAADQRAQLVHPAIERLAIESAPVVGQQRAADLHHHASGLGQRGASFRFSLTHGFRSSWLPTASSDPG